MSFSIDRFLPFVQELDLEHAQKVELITLVVDTVGVIVASAFDRASALPSCGKDDKESALTAVSAPGCQLNSLRKLFNDAGEGGANDNT